MVISVHECKIVDKYALPLVPCSETITQYSENWSDKTKMAEFMIHVNVIQVYYANHTETCVSLFSRMFVSLAWKCIRGRQVALPYMWLVYIYSKNQETSARNLDLFKIKIIAPIHQRQTQARVFWTILRFKPPANSSM